MDKQVALDTIIAYLEVAQTEALALRAFLEQEKIVSGHVLDVSYLSQWDAPDADDRPGDCGPACVAMLVHYYTKHQPTVDEVTTACRQPKTGRGKHYTGFQQLQDGALAHGLRLVIVRPLYTSRITAEIDAGHPSIALIYYGILGQYVDNQDDFAGGHWVLVMGYDDDNVIIHDPNFWGERRDEGAFRHIPREAFDKALGTPAPGTSYGHQGLTLLGE